MFRFIYNRGANIQRANIDFKPRRSNRSLRKTVSVTQRQSGASTIAEAKWIGDGFFPDSIHWLLRRRKADHKMACGFARRMSGVVVHKPSPPLVNDSAKIDDRLKKHRYFQCRIKIAHVPWYKVFWAGPPAPAQRDVSRKRSHTAAPWSEILNYYILYIYNRLNQITGRQKRAWTLID